MCLCVSLRRQDVHVASIQTFIVVFIGSKLIICLCHTIFFYLWQFYQHLHFTVNATQPVAGWNMEDWAHHSIRPANGKALKPTTHLLNLS